MLREGPGQLAEFMRQPDAERLSETLVAFANADGGTVLVGIGTSGRISILDSDDLEASLLRAQMRCRPPVKTDWQTVETPHGIVVAVAVPRSSELHTLDDGRILLRSGSRNRVLSGEEIQQLAVAKGTSSFEDETVAGASLDDLSAEGISVFEQRRRERAPRGEQLSRQEMLFNTGALDREKRVTVAGMLLFGRHPQAFLPQSGVVFVRFPGTQIGGADERRSYARREEINGPLHEVIEQTWDVLWDEMRREGVVSGLTREERPEYPEVAVREALVNAVAHRDYRLRGRRIELRMFDDRLEILSPGGLPGHITLDNIVEEHFSRNPRLVRALFYWGYIEELGIGVDRMIETMVQAGHPPPRFEAKPYSFAVILRNVRERPEQKWPDTMNERQIRALRFVEERGRVTNRDYRQLYPEISAETVRLDLADMVNKGLLLRIGDKKGTFYILK